MRLRRVRNPEAMKDEEYRYWQRQATHVRLAAVSEISSEAYALKGTHVSRLRRTLVHLEREQG